MKINLKIVIISIIVLVAVLVIITLKSYIPKIKEIVLTEGQRYNGLFIEKINSDSVSGVFTYEIKTRKITTPITLHLGESVSGGCMSIEFIKVEGKMATFLMKETCLPQD
ncbi:hypothetical protein J4204_00710 [Candidatus Woesearchaeota archaeon]|nr:hypothetical protein [Candidatus Woesearchaeota archaeon]